jgi:hypothetical protein
LLGAPTIFPKSQSKGKPMSQFAKQRLFHNLDKSALVPEGHEDVGFLYAGVGDEIPDSACELYGLIDGELADADGAEGAPKETAKQRKAREAAEKEVADAAAAQTGNDANAQGSGDADAQASFPANAQGADAANGQG